MNARPMQMPPMHTPTRPCSPGCTAPATTFDAITGWLGVRPGFLDSGARPITRPVPDFLEGGMT